MQRRPRLPRASPPRRSIWAAAAAAVALVVLASPNSPADTSSSWLSPGAMSTAAAALSAEPHSAPAGGADTPAGSSTHAGDGHGRGRGHDHPHPHGAGDGGDLDPKADFVCRRCGHTLTRRDLYMEPPSRDAAKEVHAQPDLGPGGETLTFTNVAGHAHEVATFSSATGVSTAGGAAQREHSYFPPYAWRMALCGQCGDHVGWMFEQNAKRVAMTPREIAAAEAEAAAEAQADEDEELAAATAAADEVKSRRAAGAGAASGDGGAARKSGGGGTQNKKNKKRKKKRMKKKKAKGPADPIPVSEISSESVASFKSVCMTFPRGWWTYEWCHERHVRQFHREPSGEITSDWSMGTFDAAATRGANREVRRWSTATEGEWRTRLRQAPSIEMAISDMAPLRTPYYSHVFTEGQRCDETGTGRSTEVRFVCCTGNRGAHIEALDEPITCKYHLTVCAPSLCKDVDQFEEYEADDGDDGDDDDDAGGDDDRGGTASSPASSSGGRQSPPGGGATSGGKGKAPKKQKRRRTGTSLYKMEYDDSRPRSFAGLLWNKVVATDDEALWWVNAVRPVTALTH